MASPPEAVTVTGVVGSIIAFGGRFFRGSSSLRNASESQAKPDTIFKGIR
jgi:hypothetical protein